MSLKNHYRTALVTGASSGIGAAILDMLVAEGVRVWGTARDPGRIHPRDGIGAVALELTDPRSIQEAWAFVEERSGGVDLLVNNAGSGMFGSFVDISAEAWECEIAIMLLGQARMARLALAAMRNRGRGCIVNVSSLACEFPVPFMSGYSAGKAALSALSVCLELEKSFSGLEIIDFRPGDYQTNFNEVMAANQSGENKEDTAARTWARLEETMAAAPAPERAARDLRAALMRRRSGIVRSGAFFQARLAPLLNRLVPQRISMFFRRRYFGLG